MDTFLAVISVALGVGGIAYGIYQDNLKKRIQRLSTMQAWEVHQSSGQVIGWIHTAFNEVDPQKREVIFSEVRARADGHHTKTIYNLYTHYDEVTPLLIKKWIKEGRIEENAEKDHLRYIGE